MVELGYSPFPETFSCGYRIYITGDTLLVTDLQEIPRRYNTSNSQPIDLMILHLGATTIPSPNLSPLALMVTMDAKQGVELVRLVRPDVTIPVHYDDYDVFGKGGSLDAFRGEIESAGLGGRVVYLDRGEGFRFKVLSS